MFNIQLYPIRVVVIGIVLIFFTVGCQPQAGEPNTIMAVTQEVAERQTESLAAATSSALTNQNFQVSTLTATSAPLSTTSPKPLSTPTPLSTQMITSTPWPKLPPSQASESVLSLLNDNQNLDCLLPCWWGAIPGQTKWQEVEPFLNSFASNIRTTSLGASVTLPLPEPVAVSGFDFNVVYIWNELGIIHGIDIDSVNVSGYDAKTMMTLYGIPDEVWLTTLDEPREGVLPFQLIIVYQQQGISFHYYVDATKTDEDVTACFEPGVVEMERPDLFPASPRIYLWEPDQVKTIQDISPVPLERYFRLETKTTLTPKTLYEKFTNPHEDPCISTLADLWRY